ncbi:MAG TPA: hypothetical protein VN622_10760 [Clostridia bacterium]|nr:hypothetical protein [Clostridia bacterium]
MTPILLIAANYLREQRWPAIGLFAYGIGNALAFGAVGGPVAIEDVYFYIRQQALFAALFATFLAAAAVHNDRRSRRILAVLSKAIHRGEYLAGLFLGLAAVMAAYCAVVALSSLWLAGQTQLTIVSAVAAVAIAWIASLAVICVALFFSTFLNPFFTTAATAAAIMLPALWVHTAVHPALWLSPPYYLLSGIALSPTFTFAGTVTAVVLAAIYGACFFVLATVLFSRRDVAIAIE